MNVYFKSRQPVPGKGDAWTFYECDEKLTILRYVTHIPETGETTSVAKPLVRQMTNMYAMKTSTKEEFDLYWVDPPEGQEGPAPRAFDGEKGVKYFSPDMTIGEAMSIHPRVAEVFAAFHLGGCSHCGINQYETIGQVTAGYGVDVDMLLEVLEELVQPKKAPAPSE